MRGTTGFEPFLDAAEVLVGPHKGNASQLEEEAKLHKDLPNCAVGPVQDDAVTWLPHPSLEVRPSLKCTCPFECHDAAVS